MVSIGEQIHGCYEHTTASIGFRQLYQRNSVFQQQRTKTRRLKKESK